MNINKLQRKISFYAKKYCETYLQKGVFFDARFGDIIILLVLADGYSGSTNDGRHPNN